MMMDVDSSVKMHKDFQNESACEERSYKDAYQNMLSDGRLAPSAVVNVWINTQAMLWWAVFNTFFLIKNLRLLKLMAQSYMHLKIVTKTMQTCLYVATKLNPSQAESMRQARV